MEKKSWVMDSTGKLMMEKSDKIINETNSENRVVIGEHITTKTESIGDDTGASMAIGGSIVILAVAILILKAAIYTPPSVSDPIKGYDDSKYTTLENFDYEFKIKPKSSESIPIESINPKSIRFDRFDGLMLVINKNKKQSRERIAIFYNSYSLQYNKI